MSPMADDLVQWYENERKEERKERRGLPQTPTTSQMRNLERYGEDVHSFNGRIRGEGEGKIGACHGRPWRRKEGFL